MNRKNIINKRSIVEDFARFRIGQRLIVLATKREDKWSKREFTYDIGQVSQIKVTESGYEYLLMFSHDHYGNGLNIINITYSYLWFDEKDLDFSQYAMEKMYEAQAHVPIHVSISNYHRVDAGFTNEEWEIVRDYVRKNAVQMLRVTGNDQGFYPTIRPEDDSRIKEGEYIMTAFRAPLYSVEVGFHSVQLKVYVYKDMLEKERKEWCRENKQHTDKGKFRYPKEHHRKN